MVRESACKWERESERACVYKSLFPTKHNYTIRCPERTLTCSPPLHPRLQFFFWEHWVCSLPLYPSLPFFPPPRPPFFFGNNGICHQTWLLKKRIRKRKLFHVTHEPYFQNLSSFRKEPCRNRVLLHRFFFFYLLLLLFGAASNFCKGVRKRFFFCSARYSCFFFLKKFVRFAWEYT